LLRRYEENDETAISSARKLLFKMGLYLTPIGGFLQAFIHIGPRLKQDSERTTFITGEASK
jgi:hypothetical protein